MESGIDVSNYTGPFVAETVACWRQLGYSYIICGTQRPEITRAQLAAALAGGMTADAYVFLYWDYEMTAQIGEALAAVQGFPIGRLWLDCEDAVAGRSPQEVVALIGEAVAACGATPCGIYTGRWWWLPATADSAAFAQLPLWHAEWTAGPEILPSFGGFRPYGGWTRPAIWQFQGTTQLCGAGVDLNLREARPAPPPPPPPPPEDATQQLLELLKAEREELELLRAERRFLAALIAGRYRFRPATQAAVELLRRDGEVYVPLEPPCLIIVDM
jgi:hypothetical protein